MHKNQRKQIADVDAFMPASSKKTLGFDMLASVALCVVALDWHLLRMSYLPDAVAAQVEPTLAQADLDDALGIAADGDALAAMNAIALAEKKVLKMSGDELLEAVQDCDARFSYLIEK